MKQNRAYETLKLLNGGLSASPSATPLFRRKGRVLDRPGRNPEALVAYREYLRLARGAPDIRVFTERIASFLRARRKLEP